MAEIFAFLFKQNEYEKASVVMSESSERIKSVKELFSQEQTELSSNVDDMMKVCVEAVMSDICTGIETTYVYINEAFIGLDDYKIKIVKSEEESELNAKG